MAGQASVSSAANRKEKFNRESSFVVMVQHFPLKSLALFWSDNYTVKLTCGDTRGKLRFEPGFDYLRRLIESAGRPTRGDPRTAQLCFAAIRLHAL